MVKVLGGGQLHHQLTVTADAFTDGAREAIEAEGGEVVVLADESETDDED